MLLPRARKSLIFSPDQPLKEARRSARQAAKAAQDLLLSPGKILAERPAALRLLETHLSRHVFIAGGTGRGKSKLIEMIVRQIATQRHGCTVIDPHGDTVKAILAYLAGIGFDPEDVLYLEPRLDGCFAFDPAVEAPRGASRLEYEQWLAATVDRIVKAILRNVSAAEQDLMNRLKRWLKNVLTACLVAVDGENAHAGLDKALIFTDPQRPEFAGLYEMVRDFLPADVRADFEKLIATPRPQDQEKWLESTINRLREILSPIVRLIFGQHARSVNLGEAIRQRKVVLVNLAESDFLSRDQGNMIGGLVINLLLGAARRVEAESERVTHFLVIDEAENYIGEDLRMAFAELRKFRLIVVVIVQDLSCLRKGELDLVGKVVSQCGLQGTFQQGNPEDVEFLAKAFGYGALDFTPLLADVVLPDGYEWVDTQSVSVSAGTGHTRSDSRSATRTESKTHQTHTAESIQEQVSLALSEGESEGAGWGVSASESVGRTVGTTQQQSEGHTVGVTRGRSAGVTESDGVGVSRGSSEGSAAGRSSSTSTSCTEGENWSSSHGVSRQESHGESEGRSQQTSRGVSVGQSTQTTEGRSTSRTRGEGVAASSSGNLVRSANASATEGSSVSHGRGQSVTETMGSSEGHSQTVTDTVSHGTSDTTSQGGSRAWTTGRGQGVNESWSRGTSESASASRTSGASLGVNESVSESHNVGQSRGETEGRSASTSRAVSLSGNASTSKTVTAGVSVGAGKSSASSEGISEGKSVGETTGTTDGETRGLSVTFQKTPLARHKITKEPSGKLLVAVTDQLAKYANILASLADRTLLMKCRGVAAPFLLEVHEVSPPKPADVAGFLTRMRAAHACFFDPRALPETPPTPEGGRQENSGDNPYGH